MTATSAEVWLGQNGTEVSSFVRLTERSHIMCCQYPDSAPILSVNDAHVRISVSVPEAGHVTGEDVQRGRVLAEAVARYVAELERRAATQNDAAKDAA